MRQLLFTPLLVLASLCSLGQAHTFKLSVGPSASITTLRGLDAKGYGGALTGEYFFHKKFAVNLSVAYDHFTCNLVDPWEDIVIKDFSLVPVMAGVRYYYRPWLYGGLSTGMAISASDRTRTTFAIAPVIGTNLPLGKGVLDIGLQFTGLPQTFATIPEKNLLEKGGYSYLSLRVAYGFRL
jgi:hypothetical protein